MIKKQQLYKALFAACILFSSSAVFAQVKIGTNPTVINPANNLEVESSTAGNKVSVDKTTGKVTIADGSQGAAKVLTSDVNGVATWQKVAPANVSQFPKGKIAGGTTGDLISGIRQDIAFPLTQFLEGGVTKVGNGIQVSQSGYYQLNLTATFANTAGCTGSSYASSALELAVNNTNNGLVADDKTTLIVPDNFNLGIYSLFYLNANDVVTVRAFTNYAGSPGCSNKVVAAELALSYQP